MTAIHSLAAAVALLAIGAVSQQPQAPRARHLVYELPVDALQRALRERPGQDLEQLLAGTVATLQVRLGDGADGVQVRRDGASGCVVVVPTARVAEIPAIRRLVERPTSLEMRIVAASDRTGRDFAFDLKAERARLQAWLDAGGKARVLADAAALRAFHADVANGPVAGARLQWRVRRIGRQSGRPEQWESALSQQGPFLEACVPLFGEREWNGGRVPAGAGASLVELLALDCDQRGFTGTDVEPESVADKPGVDGERAIWYRMRPDVRGPYGEWTERNVGRGCAIVWNGEVVSVPTFLGRIDRDAVISGELSDRDRAELAQFLRAGGLIAEPRFVREEYAAR